MSRGTLAGGPSRLLMGVVLAAALTVPGWLIEGRAQAQKAEPTEVEETPEDMGFPGCIEALPDSLRGLEDPDARAQARKAVLARKGAAVPDLVKALTCCDPEVRWHAADLLGVLKAGEAIDPLLQRVLHDPDVHVELRSVWALGRMERVQEIRAKGLAALADEPTALQRWRLATLLAHLRDPVSLPIIYDGLQSPDEQRRWEAVFLLSVVHDADTWNRLRPLARDPAKQVRKQVAVTYAQLGDRRAVPTLVEMLDDAEPDVRARAAMALGKTGGAGVIDALQTRLKMEQDKRVRAAISVAIRLVEHAKQ